LEHVMGLCWCFWVGPRHFLYLWLIYNASFVELYAILVSFYDDGLFGGQLLLFKV
jgi:hypothetical protein